MSSLTDRRSSRLRFPSTEVRLVCCALLAVLASLSPVKQPASAQGSSPLPILLTDVNGSWVEGRSQWVNLAWTSQRDLENVQVRATSPNPEVFFAYPSETFDHAAPTNGAELAANEVDSTSIYVSTNTGTPMSWQIDLTVSWEDQDQTHQGSATIWFDSVTVDQDTPFQPLTKEALVPSSGDGSRNWVELDYLGVSAVAGDFEVTLEGDLPVQYPQDRFASLHHDAILNPDEIDTARIWFDPQRIEPGRYEMTVNVEYMIPGDRTIRRATHPLTVNVL